MMNKSKQRIGEEAVNNQGCLMKIVEYNNAHDIVVEFQDEHKSHIHTEYRNFKNGIVKNPYYPSVYGVGIIGNKYNSVNINMDDSKEYKVWASMLQRSFDKKAKDNWEVYKEVECCNEWLLYENFYEWLHSQENFDRWHNGDKWSIDKDILIKGNKLYSPNTCLLVPNTVNCLFTKSNKARGKYPIGVSKHYKNFQSYCNNPITGIREFLGTYESANVAFYAYKKRKENIIKQVAQIEFEANNITKKCYDAMIKYEVEITD